MAKKTFSGGFDSLIGEIKQSEETAPQETPQVEDPQQRAGQAGRPTSLIGSSSQQGLREGLTRMTFIVKEEYQDKLKYCGFKTKRSIKDILNEAIEDYLAKYETMYGKIDLWD